MESKKIRTLPDGRKVFVKTNTSPQFKGILTAEAKGLELLSKVVAEGGIENLIVPAIIDRSEDHLAIEYITPAEMKSNTERDTLWRKAGKALANFHQHGSGGAYGLDDDNFIGNFPQKNEWCDDWREFFRRQRLQFQMEKAMEKGYSLIPRGRKISNVLESLVECLPEKPKRSLLHGDLWSGNFFIDQMGRGALIDPAVHYGDAESDLAMTELFGGFPTAFYEGYQAELPLTKDYRKKREIYQLYHYLNHLNIFGSGYLGAVTSILNRYR